MVKLQLQLSVRHVLHDMLCECSCSVSGPFVGHDDKSLTQFQGLGLC